jgi:hypothetical protein
LIYCKNFCKCHNVSPPSTTIKKNTQYLLFWNSSRKQIETE